MRSAVVIVLDVSSNADAQVFWAVIFVYVDVIPFQAAEPALNDYVVNPSRLAVHALPDAMFFEETCVLFAGELRTLIRIDDSRCPILVDGFCYSLQNRCCVERVGESQPTMRRLYQSIMAVKYICPCLSFI